MPICRFILLIEFTNDEELIAAVAAIEKALPGYDYASRPLNSPPGFFKFVAFKGAKKISSFPKFVKLVVALQQKLPAVKLTAGYVALSGVVTAGPHSTPGAIFGERDFHYKLQLVFSEKNLVTWAYSDELFKDKRSVSYLTDVWHLVRGGS